MQKKLEKAVELRIFFLDKNFYSMAIFSQNNKKTTIDFRQYDKKNPNRNIPFNLPNKIKIKLIKLMGKLNLNTGSIDMILTNKGEYVFLEVNPVGQFGMVSMPCNYKLEKKNCKIFNKMSNNTFLKKINLKDEMLPISFFHITNNKDTENLPILKHVTCTRLQTNWHLISMALKPISKIIEFNEDE